MKAYEITAKMSLSLKDVIAESREVAEALNSLLMPLNELKRSMQSHRKARERNDKT